MIYCLDGFCIYSWWSWEVENKYFIIWMKIGIYTRFPKFFLELVLGYDVICENFCQPIKMTKGCVETFCLITAEIKSIKFFLPFWWFSWEILPFMLGWHTQLVSTKNLFYFCESFCLPLHDIASKIFLFNCIIQDITKILQVIEELASLLEWNSIQLSRTDALKINKWRL